MNENMENVTHNAIKLWEYFYAHAFRVNRNLNMLFSHRSAAMVRYLVCGGYNL